MEEASDVQALEKISSEVDESQIKVLLSSQCIKAQAFLLDKLKKQSERHKETCSFISSANLKVETEIKQAEQEIRSMLIAQETIKSANVEIKKEWLLAKTRKADIIERVTEGKQKYEDLWMQCKSRYESIPFVQKLLEAKEKQKKTDEDILDIDKHIINLYDNMETQRKYCAKVDNSRCIELANFMVNEMPKSVNIIKEKLEMINNLTKEIQKLKEEEKKVEVVVIEDDIEPLNLNLMKPVDVPDVSKSEDDPLIPKLNLVNFDLDIIDVNLDQVRLKKNQFLNTIPPKSNSITQNFNNPVEQRCESEKAYDYMISPYFKSYKEDKPRNFSERKLINILEDININDGDVYNIVKKVNPEQLKTVGEISAETVDSHKMTPNTPRDREDKRIVSEDIEEIDLTASNDNIIVPPIQFLDISLSSDTQRKKVSFDLQSSMQIVDEDIQEDIDVNESGNHTVNSQLNASVGSDESFLRIRDMLLKKHNLDLSPQFEYTKNNVLQKKEADKMFQKGNDMIVTSKFFQTYNDERQIDKYNDNAMEIDEQAKVEEANEVLKPKHDVTASAKDPSEDILIPMDLDDIDMSNPLKIKQTEEQKSEKQITGLLFTHSTQGIADSLNLSMSTTGFEDADFPHCIDASLLLSPKADIPPTNDNQEVMSQEVPNFLSGFRKTGFSFFGGPSTASEHKPDSSAENEANNDNFSFSFGGDKKNRGGLFSLFH